MSAISFSSQQFSPNDRLKALLNSAVSSGEIAQTDKAALSSVLDSIDQSLKSERSSSQTAGSRPDPSKIKEKIDSLIDGLVADGKLTDDQASELKSLFAQGKPPAPPARPAEEATSLSSLLTQSTDDSESTEGTSLEDKVARLISDFLESLRDTLKSSATYGAGGASSSSSTSFALVLDIQS